jgi:hypothetical protein
VTPQRIEHHREDDDEDRDADPEDVEMEVVHLPRDRRHGVWKFQSGMAERRADKTASAIASDASTSEAGR